MDEIGSFVGVSKNSEEYVLNRTIENVNFSDKFDYTNVNSYKINWMGHSDSYFEDM